MNAILDKVGGVGAVAWLVMLSVASVAVGAFVIKLLMRMAKKAELRDYQRAHRDNPGYWGSMSEWREKSRNHARWSRE